MPWNHVQKPAFVGMEVGLPVKTNQPSVSCQAFSKVENIRFIPSLHDKSGYLGRTFDVVLYRISVTGGITNGDEFLPAFNRLFKRPVNEYLSENLPSTSISPIKFLINVPNNIDDDERDVSNFIQRDITLTEAQENYLKDEANALIGGIGKKVNDFLNELKKTLTNEQIRGFVSREFDEYHADDTRTIVEGVFQYSPEVSWTLQEPFGRNTLTVPPDYKLAFALKRGGQLPRAKDGYSGVGLGPVLTFGVDPWPFVVISTNKISTGDIYEVFAIARIDGRFYVRKIRKAETESQYEMLALLGITEMLPRSVA
jgi:hypothetical protein